MEQIRLLAINPGSTSTKIAVFENEREMFAEAIDHSVDALRSFADVQDQLPYRKEAIDAALEAAGIAASGIDVFVGRGGGLVSVKGGTYAVTGRLLEDARKGMAGQHPAQLGSQICDLYVREYGGAAFIVNPPDVDEYDEIARISGLSGVCRQSHVHALNQKEISLRYCAAQGIDYANVNLIVCHIGGGISVTAHRRGCMADSNDILKGEGPMMPNRAGSLSTVDLLKLCYSGEYTEREIKDRLTRKGGLIDHLGTDDAREIERRIEEGDAYAKIVYDAMLYQISKNIGSCAIVLKGDVKAIILTGGISNSDYVTGHIKGYVSWLAPVEVMAGEFEMEALVSGALRVIRGAEKALEYTGVPVWSGFHREDTQI
jgi:butyrate kinase